MVNKEKLQSEKSEKTGWNDVQKDSQEKETQGIYVLEYLLGESLDRNMGVVNDSLLAIQSVSTESRLTRPTFW